MPSRIKPRSIKIERAEGLIEECNKPVTVKSWSEANAVLRRWSGTAPKAGGYDKCDFWIEFEDGHQYDGRYDLKHWSVEAPDLAAHVSGFVNYLAGNAPAWVQRDPKQMARYRQFLASDPAGVASAQKWLETYALYDEVAA